MTDSDRVKMVLKTGARGGRETGGASPRTLPSLPPLDIKRVARPGRSTTGDTPPEGSSGARRRKPPGGKGGKGRAAPQEDAGIAGEFRALGVNSPVPASHPPDHHEVGGDGDGDRSSLSSASPFPAITVERCEDARRESPGERIPSSAGTSPDLTPDTGGVARRRDSDLLSPTPPLHRRSLDNKYTTYHGHQLSSSKSEGCLEYLGNIQQAREARNQRYLLETDKAASTQGIWVSTTRRASGEISPLATGPPESPHILSLDSSPSTSPLSPRKPARLMPLRVSRGKSS